jgi:hypothetical protein
MDPNLLTRRHLLRTAPAAALAPLLLRSHAWAAPPAHKLQVDVCVYGGASGGVIAAVALARLGRSVALIEPTRHLGGMTTGGLGWVDVKHGGLRAFAGLTGEYFHRVRDHYTAQGIDPRTFGNDGAVAEPHVAEAILEQMLQEQSKHLTILRETRLASIQKQGRRIRTLILDKAPVDPRGAPSPNPIERSWMSISAAIFIDASYEGDLLAAAHIAWRGDRESRDEFGEPHAGIIPNDLPNPAKPAPLLDPYRKPGDPSSGLLPLISSQPLAPTGSASPIVQAFNFRLCLVKQNHIPIQPGSNYNPANYEIAARLLAAQSAAGNPLHPAAMHTPGKERLLKFSAIPNGKVDLNSSGPVSMDDLTGGAQLYARATWAQRARIWHAHEDYQRGLFYFLQTAPRVPEDIRADLTLWGLAPHEFPAYILRQSDCQNPPPDLPDSVAIGTYSIDSHACQRLAAHGQVIREGEFYEAIPHAYPIPYKTLTPHPQACENLLATFCVSATHVSFASVRMEPPYMVLSESAAHAAHLALEQNTTVQTINPQTLAKRLRNAGQILTPTDIPNP